MNNPIGTTILALATVAISLTSPVQGLAQSSGQASGAPAAAPAQGAAKGGGSLAADATNPASALIQLQFQDQITPNSANSDGAANSFIIQPVYPFVIGPDHYFQAVVTRTTIPIVATPDLPGFGRTTGMGDTTVVVVPNHKSPSKTKKGEFTTWGPVAAFRLPTATEDATGSGQFSVGPGLLGLRNFTNVFANGDSLLVGAFGYQLWSVLGESGRKDVNETFAQPILVYHFNELFDQKGWYTGLPDDLWQYNWEDSELAQVTAGARLGRVFNIGKVPVNMFVQSWYNPVEDGPSPKWTVKFNLTFLFPE